MKEKIINFLKSKPQISFFNKKLSPEAKFIILGLFYILIALNVMMSIRIFDLFTFFCVYFCVKHLLSKPTFSKKRVFVSSIIIIIFILELLTLIVYFYLIFLYSITSLESNGMRFFTTILSFILFLAYWIINRLKSNPNKIINIFKTFIFEFFQFSVVAIFYISAIIFLPKSDFSRLETILIIINIILLTSSNILTKRVSKILEILCFGFIFANLIIFSFSNQRTAIEKYLSHENYLAIFIVMANLIGFCIIFFKNKNRAEKAKIILLIALMLSFFFYSNRGIRCFYYLSSLAIVSLIIFCETLKASKVLMIFITINIIMLSIFSMLSQGRGGGFGFALLIILYLNLILLPIITITSNQILAKNKLIKIKL